MATASPPVRPATLSAPSTYHPVTPFPNITIAMAPPTTQPTIATLFDASITWLNSIGITTQWGTSPRSQNPEFLERIRSIYTNSLVLEARTTSDHPTHPDTALGFIGIGNTGYNPYPGVVPDMPEGVDAVHITVLIRNRETPEISAISKGIGRALVEEARKETQRRKVPCLRVDCYGGGEGALVKVYESMGFTRRPLEPVIFKKPGQADWEMQVLEMWFDEELERRVRETEGKR
jgi:ribosomal protein S18 acetylase RimI-like enzyme